MGSSFPRIRGEKFQKYLSCPRSWIGLSLLRHCEMERTGVGRLIRHLKMTHWSMSSQLFRFLQSQPPQQKVNIPHLPSDLRFLGFQIAQSLEKCNKSHESSIANKLVLNFQALPSNECGKKVVFKNSCILTAQQHHPKHNIEVESQLVNSPNVWGIQHPSISLNYQKLPFQ